MRLYVDQFVDIVLLWRQINLVLKIIYTRDIMALRILVTRVNFVLFLPLTKCVKMVSTTVKNFNMNRMKDFKSTIKPVSCVLYFAWNNQNLDLPVQDLEARASTVTLCLSFLAYSCASLADFFHHNHLALSANYLHRRNSLQYPTS